MASEAGFGMIEVMVSMVLLTALALATFSLIDRTTQASAQVRAKSLAADIAHDDLNRMRQLKFSLVSGVDYQSKSVQTGVDNVQYTVVSTATWATDSGVETSCATPTVAGNSSYLRIRSSVSWPSMTGAPVVADSIMAPRGKEANRTTGSLMVKVQDRGGASVAGATVAVAGQTLVTSAAGCVFFPAIAAGQWPVTITKVATPYNYMDSDGNSPGLATASVVVGDVSTVSESFDIPSLFDPVTFYREDNTTGATWTSITAASQSKTISYTSTPAGTPVTSVTTGLLFPFASGWSLYAGNCTGNNPGLYANNTSAMANSSSIPAPGATVTDGRAYMRKVTARVTDASLTSGSETIKVYAKSYKDSTYTSMTGCTEVLTPQPTGTMTSTTKTVDIAFDLPYGLYTICAENNKTGSSYRAANFTSPVAPSGAYKTMPTMAGVTAKTSAPANDTNATPAIPITSKSSGYC